MKKQITDIQPRPVPGKSRAEEEAQLKLIISVAKERLKQAEAETETLSGQLHELMESYGPKEKEGLSMLRNIQVQMDQSKRDLMRRKKAREKPYFGRIDFKDAQRFGEECYYIGRAGIFKSPTEPIVIDWRAPVASLYYENTSGRCRYTVKNEGTYEVELRLKRTYEIENDQLKDYFDSDVVANDALLTKYLARNKTAVLGEIIATIQQEQNDIIRRSPKFNLIVQGVAGSGKTTVAMHRISYILYNYEEDFRPEDFYIIGSNRILLDYITSALPDLDVYGVRQMTMEQLFVRLLYEDWDDKRYRIRALDPADSGAWMKGSSQWFHALEAFCCTCEQNWIPRASVYVEETGALLMETADIDRYIKNHPGMSMQEKISGLNAVLLSRLENEMSGRYVTYPEALQKQLLRRYGRHFGGNVWKGSVFELYEQFLCHEEAAGNAVTYEKNDFDLYDLAALAYLYRRIKETDGIREASHMIIDEAQDFGMMAYEALAYCLRDCTYTIMGDVSQNIHCGYGLNDWEPLKKLFLPDGKSGFCILKKSYRNTIEISEFAAQILRHGSFAIYPAEPVCRHGHPVCIRECLGEAQMLLETEALLRQWLQEGRETLAVICGDDEEAAMVRRRLGASMTLADSDPESAGFIQGIMVLSVTYTKGLEFDGVVIYHPSRNRYPSDDASVRQLYVAVTRALHELAIVHQGDLTDLIALPAERDANLILPETSGDTANISRDDLPVQPGAPQQIVQPGEEATPGKHLTVPLLKYRDNRPINPSPYHFGDCPASGALRSPFGTEAVKAQSSGSGSSAVKKIKKTKHYLDVASVNGVLRLTPLAADIIRVQYKKDFKIPFKESFWEASPDILAQWRVRAGRSIVEAATDAVTVRFTAATGALSFFTPEGKLLLAEDPAHPRDLKSGGAPEAWSYFNWRNDEKIYAKGLLNDTLERMAHKARYISFGGMKMRMPLLVSDAGYGIGIAAPGTVLCCAISMYGTYVYADGTDQTDYYFLYGKSREGAVKLYRKLTDFSGNSPKPLPSPSKAIAHP